MYFAASALSRVLSTFSALFSWAAFVSLNEPPMTMSPSMMILLWALACWASIGVGTPEFARKSAAEDRHEARELRLRRLVQVHLQPGGIPHGGQRQPPCGHGAASRSNASTQASRCAMAGMVSGLPIGSHRRRASPTPPAAVFNTACAWLIISLRGSSRVFQPYRYPAKASLITVASRSSIPAIRHA